MGKISRHNNNNNNNDNDDNDDDNNNNNNNYYYYYYLAQSKLKLIFSFFSTYSFPQALIKIKRGSTLQIWALEALLKH